MATTRTIQNAGQGLIRPDGSPLANATLRFTLVDAQANPVAAFSLEDNAWVASYVSVRTDANGEFSVSLIPNSLLAGETYYHADTGGAHGYKPFKAQLVEGATPIAFVIFHTSGQTLSAAQITALASHIQSTNPHTTTFLSLPDTPPDYAGLGGRYLKVADAEDGIEASAGSGTADKVSVLVTAGIPIIGHFGVVVVNGLAYHFDAANPTHYGAVIGVASQSFLTGQQGIVQSSGRIVNAGWGLTTGPVFLSATGGVTNTPPATGILQRIGTADSADSIYINTGYIPFLQ